VLEQQRALPHVVEHQARIDQRQPAHADGLAPEVAHVGVERLGAGHREEHRAHRQEREPRIVAKNANAQ
jgi:hypothetical protein